MTVALYSIFRPIHRNSYRSLFERKPIRIWLMSQAESDEKILTFDIPDETLERAESAEQNAFPINALLH